MRRLFLAALAAASLAMVSDAYSQAQQNFTLINRSGQQIDEVYVSATSQNQWGRDILGDGVMPSGTRRNITFPQRTRACRFDHINCAADRFLQGADRLLVANTT